MDLICKIQGYDEAAYDKSFGPGSGPIWMKDLDCDGTESSLSQCRHNGWGPHDCNHDGDFGLHCRSHILRGDQYVRH